MQLFSKSKNRKRYLLSKIKKESHISRVWSCPMLAVSEAIASDILAAAAENATNQMQI